MATLAIDRSGGVKNPTNGSLLNDAFSDIATVGLSPQSASSTTALYSSSSDFITINGDGFSYDSNNKLVAGVITSVDVLETVKAVGGYRETYTGLAIPVAQAIALAGMGANVEPAILAGNDTILVNGSQALGYGGDDTFTVLGAGSAPSYYSPPTTLAIDGGSGVNAAVFPVARRAQAQISGGGGTETVVQSGITANLVSIARLQFIDGSVYENTASRGAQAALIFEGIFGRVPDAINAGGYARLAEQTDTTTAARAMLATPEAQANTASLDTAGFVAQLYRNVLHREPDVSGAAGWQSAIDGGTVDRATVAGLFASSAEAAQTRSAALASGSVFAADPAAVEVLRAYEVLLGRLPDAAGLVANVNGLNRGADLAQIYLGIQGSAEFAGAAHSNGLSAGSSYAAVRSVALSDQTTALITPLVTNQGVAVIT